MLSLTGQLRAAGKRADAALSSRLESIDGQIDGLVEDLYGITPTTSDPAAG